MPSFAAPDGRHLVFDDIGPRDTAQPPVLCLAGLTRDARDFNGIAGHLSPRRRVISHDARGRGRSARADDPMTEYTLPVEAGDAIALLDHLEIPSAVVIGTSRGGLQAMAIATAAKDRLAGVLLNDIGPVVEREGLENIMTYIGVAPKAADRAGAAAALSRSMARHYPDFEQADWLALAENLFVFGEDGAPMLSYDPRLAEPVKATFGAPQPDLWPYFDAFEGVPLACIRGAHSDILSAATLQEMARRRPDMLHVTLSNRGHVPLLTEPEALALTDRFLATCA
ncbi:MAG: alpha/beta hydrolase [Pseudomonadota bacterium]